MKGVIAVCLGDLVKEKFGKDKWDKCLEHAGLPKTTFFLPTGNVDDAAVLKVVDSVCKVLNITLNQAADAFGDYWVNVYAPKIYKSYYRDKKTAKEFLSAMDQVHKTVTETIAGAKPPRFDYELQGDKVMIMKYNSHRGLIDFFIGLLKGVGRYFNEKLTITALGGDKVKIVFP
ncbi:MAG: heme NO-binding domain-containing protein [Candidatus Omnitrophota bacterium]